MPSCPDPVQLGLVGEERAAGFAARRAEIEETEALLDSVRLSSSAWGRQGFQVAQDGGWVSAAAMLTRPGTSLGQLAGAAEAEQAPGWQQLAELAAVGGGGGGGGDGRAAGAHGGHSSSGVATAVYNCHYRPYLKKMEAEVAELRRDEALRIPAALNYSSLQLSAEDREKLTAARPASLAAAQRIPGVTPAALLLLLQHVRKRQPRGGGGSGSERSRVAQAAAAEAGAGT